MTTKHQLPRLAGDFGLVGVAEAEQWRDALARHTLDGMGLPAWKVEEQIAPVNATIALLLAQGMRSPTAIAQYIQQMGSANAPSL